MYTYLYTWNIECVWDCYFGIDGNIFQTSIYNFILCNLLLFKRDINFDDIIKIYLVSCFSKHGKHSRSLYKQNACKEHLVNESDEKV